MDNERLIAAICRPLVWESGYFCGADAFYSADPVDGWSVIQFSGRNGRWAIDDPFGNASDDDWGTALEAQAAAEADYRARIAAALDLDKIGRLVEAADRHLTTLTAYFKGMGGANGGKLAADSLEAERDFRAALAELEGAK